MQPLLTAEQAGLNQSHSTYWKRGQGGDPRCSPQDEGEELCTGLGDSGQMHPQSNSFNQKIKLLSSGKLCIHGRSPFIQL